MTASTDPHWRQREETPEEVVSRVNSGMRLFVHGACATPAPLLEALSRRRQVEGVRLYHLHTAGEAPFAAEDLAVHAEGAEETADGVLGGFPIRSLRAEEHLRDDHRSSP